MTRPETSHDQREATCAATSITTMASTKAAGVFPCPWARMSAARRPTAAIRMTADFGSAGLRRAATMPQSRDSALEAGRTQEVRLLSIAPGSTPVARRGPLGRARLRRCRLSSSAGLVPIRPFEGQAISSFRTLASERSRWLDFGA